MARDREGTILPFDQGVKLTQDLSRIDWRSQTRQVWSVSLADLGSPDVQLLHPLTVMMEDHDGEEVISSWPEVELWASGATEADAINGLKDAIVDLHVELARAQEGELGRLPARWKRALDAVVVKRGSDQ